MGGGLDQWTGPEGDPGPGPLLSLPVPPVGGGGREGLAPRTGSPVEGLWTVSTIEENWTLLTLSQPTSALACSSDRKGETR